LIFEAQNIRLMREHNERAWMIWHSEALHRQKRLPAMSTLQARPPIAQDWEAQLAELKAWVVATGGKIITRDQA
jgi:hypothetical protein